MAKKATLKSTPPPINIDMGLKSIELVDFSLNYNQDLSFPIEKYSFCLEIKSSVEKEQNLVIINSKISIFTNPENGVLLGMITANCIFEINNLLEVLAKENESSSLLPQFLLDTLVSISISTTRGIMFSQFRGTFLHNAILPVVDPRQLTIVDMNNLQ